MDPLQLCFDNFIASQDLRFKSHYYFKILLGLQVTTDSIEGCSCFAQIRFCHPLGSFSGDGQFNLSQECLFN